MEHGRNLLAESMQKLHEAERTMDDYRAADEALDGKLRAAKEEIQAAEEAEETARAEGVAVEPLKLRPEYDLVATRLRIAPPAGTSSIPGIASPR